MPLILDVLKAEYGFGRGDHRLDLQEVTEGEFHSKEHDPEQRVLDIVE